MRPRRGWDDHGEWATRVMLDVGGMGRQASVGELAQRGSLSMGGVAGVGGYGAAVGVEKKRSIRFVRARSV